jgi:hypothetical protein
MATWQEIQQGIFAGESGGNYNALFGYQNRPGGIFSDVKVSEMSIADILNFTNPSGAYGQFVANTRPDPEMGVATPVGAYQVVGTTLRDAVKALGIDPSQKFDKATQDRIGKYIFETQGAKAFAGYKGPKMDGQQPTAQQMQQMQQQPRGLMGFLRDPRTRQTLASLDRSGMFQGIAEQATRDIVRQEERQTANRTAAWLKTQPGGEPYAQAIESGMDARAVYTQYMRDKDDSAGENVQSRTMLPDNSGSVVTMRDGTQFVLTSGGQKLTGPEADKFVTEAQERYTAQQRDIYGARRSGTLGANIDLGGAAAAATEEGKQRPGMVKDFMEQASLVKSNITNLTDAIKAIDEGAKSGIVYNMLPNVSRASASLKNAMDRMGLDVIGSVTFGALSEGEMRLAMETAVPRNLSEDNLRAWLVEKEAAQRKALDALNNAALWFAGGGTLKGYLEGQQETGSQTSTSENPLGL